MHFPSSFPASRGAALALLAAVLFGVTIPLLQRTGEGVGQFTTAALLYLGASAVGAAVRRPAMAEARPRAGDAPWLLAMAVSGSALAPVALAWGLQRTSAMSASLILTVEAVFTAVFAYGWYRESLDRRLLLALLSMTAGGMLLVLDRFTIGEAQVVGLLAVVGATAAWGLDNTLSRRLAERDPGQVVSLKALIGAAMTGSIALARDERLPQATEALGLFMIGASGYGLSLRFYLLAQREFGAARTGSVFAFAPFIGALVALALGDAAGGRWMAVGAVLMVCGVILHLAESHEHWHRHSTLSHEHAHSHDDGHHGHFHDRPPDDAHSHLHHHPAAEHAHPHVPDVHHRHPH